MAEPLKLNHPWLVAVWPGMGGVALSAGYFLLAKLGMHLKAEYDARDLFDIEQVEVKGGLIQPGRRPRSRFFVWTDPKERRDLVLFLGEAQPPAGKERLCHTLIEFAREQGVERVFTFAAMATEMRPQHPSRVFAAATDADGLQELKRLGLPVMKDGHIGGLNGVLLGVAAESGVPGTCLLGEMPHVFHQLPFPKGSLALLEVFAKLAGVELDFTELAEQARAVEQQLSDLLARIEHAYIDEPSPPEEAAVAEPAGEIVLSAAAHDRLEELFAQAEQDRAKAYELKQELDQLGVFKEYEDRFLDLFKKPEAG